MRLTIPFQTTAERIIRFHIRRRILARTCIQNQHYRNETAHLRVLCSCAHVSVSLQCNHADDWRRRAFQRWQRVVLLRLDSGSRRTHTRASTQVVRSHIRRRTHTTKASARSIRLCKTRSAAVRNARAAHVRTFGPRAPRTNESSAVRRVCRVRASRLQ